MAYEKDKATKLERSKKSRKGLTNDQKREMVAEWLTMKDLKLNKKHLQSLFDKYGAYAYDIVQLAHLNPKTLMNSATRGREEVLAENPIAQDFLADKNSITTDKALEFFAELPTDNSMLAHVFEYNGKENIAKEMRASAYLASRGVKQSGGSDMSANQKKLEGRMGAQAAGKDKKVQKTTTSKTTTQTKEGGR